MSDEFITSPLPAHKHFNNLTGRVFERLTIVSFAGMFNVVSYQKAAYWNCVCSCPAQTKCHKILAANLLKNHTRSCGCLRIDIQTIHGLSKTRVFYCYQAMIQRCFNQNCTGYHNYGERGITVCERWLGTDGFLNFFADKGHPKRGQSIDRINNDGDYTPENTRWTDNKTQSRNKRTNHTLTYRGETEPLLYFAEKYGINPNTLLARIRDGMSTEDAIEMPINVDIYEYLGESGTLTYFANKYGFKKITIVHRLRNGWSIDKALSTMVKPSKRWPEKKI